MNRRQRKLARRVKRQARRAGVTGRELEAVKAVASDPMKLDLLQDQIDEARLNPWNGPDNLYGKGFKEILANLWDWFVANWPTILKFIITIAPLLLEPRYEDS